MNRFFRHLSLSIALSLLCASAYTHSMRVKKLAKRSSLYSLMQKNTTNKVNPDDPLTQFCALPSTQKATKKLVRRMPKKVLLRLVEQMKETEQAQALQANINTSAITNKIQPTESLDDDSEYDEEDPYLSPPILSFKSPEKAAEALRSISDHTRYSALHFFMKRIKKKQDLALIACIAEQTFTAPEEPLTLGCTRQAALQIFTALAEQGYIPDTALQAAATGMLTQGWGHVRWEARNLFEALLQNDHPHTVEVATQAAINVFLEQDWRTIYNGLQLFNIIFSHGKGFEEATQFAEHASQHKDWELRKSALKLLQALVEHDQAIALSEQIAMQQIKDFAVPAVQAQAFLLLIGLVKKNHAIESAMQAINFVSSNNQYLAKNPIYFYHELKLLCSEKTKIGDEGTAIALDPPIEFWFQDTPKPQTKLKWGPLKDLDFKPATKLDFPPKKAEPWSGEAVEEISVDEAIYGISELGKRHKAFIEEYGDYDLEILPLIVDRLSDDPEYTPAKQLDLDNCSENIPLYRASDGDFDNLNRTPAWRELDIDVCGMNIPIARPDDGKPSDPKYTLLPGEEKKLTQAMCELMRGNKEAGLTPFEDDTNISPSHCTSKALMCIPDSGQSEKKKRLLKDELKYPHGQPMGGDTLAYSVAAKEFAAGLEEFEKQHRANVDKCGKE